MAAMRSDQFYFARGDLVIQVENTLFRLHKDILERHSRFFEDLLSLPNNDNTEGTEGDPLVLPVDLCSAHSFTILCNLLYPRQVNSRPTVSASQLDEWEPVLHATAALQMAESRKFILSELEKDRANTKSNAAKLLRLSIDYNEDVSASFLKTCLLVLTHRCQRITPDEIIILGEKGTCMVNYARERVREVQAMFQSAVIEVLKKQPVATQTKHCLCKFDFLIQMTKDFYNGQLEATGDRDVFQDDGNLNTCDTCTPDQEKLKQSLRQSLDQVIDDCIREVLSYPRRPQV